MLPCPPSSAPPFHPPKSSAQGLSPWVSGASHLLGRNSPQTTTARPELVGPVTGVASVSTSPPLFREGGGGRWRRRRREGVGDGGDGVVRFAEVLQGLAQGAGGGHPARQQPGIGLLEGLRRGVPIDADVLQPCRSPFPLPRAVDRLQPWVHARVGLPGLTVAEHWKDKMCFQRTLLSSTASRLLLSRGCRPQYISGSLPDGHGLVRLDNPEVATTGRWRCSTTGTSATCWTGASMVA